MVLAETPPPPACGFDFGDLVALEEQIALESQPLVELAGDIQTLLKNLLPSATEDDVALGTESLKQIIAKADYQPSDVRM